MQIGYFMDTHGLGIRDDDDWWLQPIPASEMEPLEIARIGEENGFHSLWFSDHVAMPPQSVPITYANPDTGKRHYPARPVMLDGAAVMGAVAATTTRIKMAPSVLIAPYRPPMHDARQFSTIDHLSNGRLIMGVGAGWCREEFEGLGLRFEDRVSMTEECIEIYKRAWDHESELVSFQGQHYRFQNLSMDPKPLQRPHPPIIYGGTTPLGARVAARSCDGLYPMFPSPKARPDDKDSLLEIIRREADRNGRDLSQFALLGSVSARVTDADDPHAGKVPRPICGGTPEQVLSDLERFAEHGYCLMVLHLDCPSRSVDELKEQLYRVAEEVLPTAATFRPQGEWRKEL